MQYTPHSPPLYCVQAPDLTCKCYTNLNKNTLAYFAALLAMKKIEYLKIGNKEREKNGENGGKRKEKFLGPVL